MLGWNTPRNLLRRLAQETDISKSSAATAAKLFKLRYNATVVHALQTIGLVKRREG